MAVDPQVVVNIASEFTGKKAFKDAESATGKLQKGIKTLAKSLGLAFSVTSVVAFGKAAAKAFIQDEAAAAKLTKTVTNLGLGFEDARVKAFISDMEALSGVTDSQLRPAFEKLLTTTGSVNKSQDLLKTALDVAAGSGQDLVTVASDLSKAYLGNTKGLTKYNIGLTQAELKAASFEDIQAKLNTQFSGQNQARLDTYAGKIDLLKVSFDNMQETIGKSLVDGFALLAGDQGIGSATKAMAEFGQQIADVITGVATLTSVLNKLPKSENMAFFDVGNIPVLGAYLKILQGIGEAQRLAPKPFTTPMTLSGSLDAQNKINAARKKAEAEAAKRAKELLALIKKQAAAEKLKLQQKKDQLALDKAALALGKGTDVFDLDKIQIQAAILAKQDEINKLGANATEQQKLQLANDAQRLTVKQLMLDLEDAIADKDVERATTLSKQLNTELAILGTLTGQTYKLSQIDDILAKFKPKDLINLDNLDAAIAKLLAIAGSRFDFLSPIMPSQDRTAINELAPDITSRYVAGDPEAIRAVEAHADAISMLADSELALADALLAESERALNIATASLTSAQMPNFMGFDPGRFRMADNITVNVNAGVVGSEDTISLAVQRAILDLERRGDPLRYTGGL
jgi:hypothetical protein